MTNVQTSPEIVAAITEQVPYLRRYARALTGSQSSGDAYAIATLEAVVADPAMAESARSPRVALFRAMHGLWRSSDLSVPGDTGGRLESAAQRHLSRLTADTREALLLNTIEEFDKTEIAEILDVSLSEVTELIAIAHREMASSVAGKVMIIEDEAIIAMDIEAMVTEMGHVVTGVARTHEGALKLARDERPDLILADIQLADKSSGIDAVNELLGELGEMPVIFITAFPERLLTGNKPEPAFLITKPYTEDQVRSAVTQAMFFSSTETLMA